MTETALWYEKHRPRTLEDYIWCDDEIKSRIQNWIQYPENLPHLILEGPPGTGKTTLAKIIINELGLDPTDYLFINTNKHSGVDAIRDEVTNFCEAGGWSGLKIVVIDEADGLSIAAQDKLRGVINDYGSYVRFIFTCNRIRALSDALKSRARTITIAVLDVDEFIGRLVRIGESEKVDLDTEFLESVVSEYYPDLRKAIDMLQHGGVLQTETKESSSWEQTIVDIIEKRSRPSRIRELTASLRKDEVEDVYKFLYQNSGELFSDALEGPAVVMIADYLYRHQLVSFPEINLAGLLNKLVQLQEMEE